MMEGEVGASREQHAQASVEETIDRIDPGEAAHAIASFARENPHVALAVAAGIGFLLGGGLTPRMLGTFGAMATRGYLRGSVTQALKDVISGQLRPESQPG